MSALSIVNIHKRYAKTVVLDGFGLDVDDGEILLLVGPNGGGKSTLLGIAHGSLSADSGKLVSTFNRHALLPQRSAETLFPYYNLRRNLCLPLIVARVPPREWDQRIMVSLKEMGLDGAVTPLLARHPFEVSGGQQQLVTLARSLLERPDLLLLDEPAKELDPWNAQSLMHAIRHWAFAQPRRAVVITSHSLEHVLRIATRVLLLDGPPVRVIGSWTLGGLGTESSLDGARDRVAEEVRSAVHSALRSSAAQTAPARSL
ncbi:MAG: ABC transporter ATP-binding protein [Planctomycetes bacterium]|nr:ABC transporter ATP-binding protein [Planctomycetota bacterium]